MNHEEQNQELTEETTANTIAEMKRAMLTSLTTASGGNLLRGCCTQGCCIDPFRAE